MLRIRKQDYIINCQHRPRTRAEADFPYFTTTLTSLPGT